MPATNRIFSDMKAGRIDGRIVMTLPCVCGGSMADLHPTDRQCIGQTRRLMRAAFLAGELATICRAGP